MAVKILWSSSQITVRKSVVVGQQASWAVSPNLGLSLWEFKDDCDYTAARLAFTRYLSVTVHDRPNEISERYKYFPVRLDLPNLSNHDCIKSHSVVHLGSLTTHEFPPLVWGVSARYVGCMIIRTHFPKMSTM